MIFNDALHWTYERDTSSRCEVGLAALRPGGALVFFFADAREPDEGAGSALLEWDWSQLGEPERVDGRTRRARSRSRCACTRHVATIFR
ncbi:MAG: hypothetical protein R3B99_33180 [Polyangiales bacterium]